MFKRLNTLTDHSKVSRFNRGRESSAMCAKKTKLAGIVLVKCGRRTHENPEILGGCAHIKR